MALARTVWEWLQADYPDYPWSVSCRIEDNPRVRLVTIQIPDLMCASLGVHIHLDNYPRPLELVKAVHEHAGELLERFRLRRSKMEDGEFTVAKQTKRVWSHNDPLPE